VGLGQARLLQRREVLLNLRLELRPADGVVEFRTHAHQDRRVLHIHQDRTLGSHRGERRLDRCVDFRVVSQEVSGNTNPGSLQRASVEELGVVEIGGNPTHRLLGGGITGIGGGRDGDSQGHRDVRHRPRHGSAGIKGKRQRNDAGAREKSVGGLSNRRCRSLSKGRGSTRPCRCHSPAARSKPRWPHRCRRRNPRG
jgi:hypothetical protein